jgi:hypothetical protein
MKGLINTRRPVVTVIEIHNEQYTTYYILTVPQANDITVRI